MGSKRVMLQNGLGELLRATSKKKERLVDLFSGSASVSWFAAATLELPVIAVDLQSFAAILARSVLARTQELDPNRIEVNWLRPLAKRLARSKAWRKAQALDLSQPNAGSWAKRARQLCSDSAGSGPSWRAYGGYYFSPSQAFVLDSLRSSVPARGPERWVCTAALIMAASRCAAAPGHTAQPFGTSRSAGPYLREAWMRDPVVFIRRAVGDLSRRFARVKGSARVGDAVQTARCLRESDLVFVDPPYSGVHYSRFYHVLETLARGKCGPVGGSGRYPARDERPSSLFSQKSNALAAMELLLQRVSDVGCTAILTFPNHECSNGLSGRMVTEAAAEHFRIVARVVKTRFSTLGGNGESRKARLDSDELILLLNPK